MVKAGLNTHSVAPGLSPQKGLEDEVVVLVLLFLLAVVKALRTPLCMLAVAVHLCDPMNVFIVLITVK